MADGDEPTYRHRRVPIALASATILVGLLALRVWDAGLIGPAEVVYVGTGISLGLAVILLERQELAFLLSLGGRLRGSVVVQLTAVFAILALLTMLTAEFGFEIDLMAFACLATITVGELVLLANET